MKQAFVIDDEEVNLDLFSRIIQRKDYHVYTAKNIEELFNSMDKLKEKQMPLDLVLCDTNLTYTFAPLYYGPDLIREFSKKYPQTFANATIIGMSGIPNNKSLWYNLADYFLNKPFSIKELTGLL